MVSGAELRNGCLGRCGVVLLSGHEHASPERPGLHAVRPLRSSDDGRDGSPGLVDSLAKNCRIFGLTDSNRPKNEFEILFAKPIFGLTF
jgi:hypothetical protein